MQSNSVQWAIEAVVLYLVSTGRVMLQVGNIYTTRDNSIVHLHRFEDGAFHGAIEDHGLIAWDVNGKCLTGYEGWDILGDGTTLQLAHSPKIDARRKQARQLLTAPNMQVYPGGVSEYGVSPAMWWDRVGYTGPLSLVMHATAGGGSAKNTFDYFMDATVLKCSHFIVGSAGDIYQCGDVRWAAAANGSCTSGTGWWPTNMNGNFYTASIEIFKPDSNNATWPTDAQYKALIPLVKWICDTLHIPKRQCSSKDGGITTHSIFDPVHRPGNYDPNTMDWDRLYRGLNPNPIEVKFMQQQMLDTWDMLLGRLEDETNAALLAANPNAQKVKLRAPYETGIAQSWRNNYQKFNAGSPLGVEKKSVSWSGRSIQLQWFSGGYRCEWDNASAKPTWFDCFHNEVTF